MSTPFPDSPAGRVVVVGSLNIDFVWTVPTLPRPGQTLVADAAKCEFGGKGANQAVAAARYGAHVAMIGAVGCDADGARYLERLKHEGIDTTWIAMTGACATGAAHVYVDRSGENAIVINHGANARVERTQVTAALDALLPTADILLLQHECPREAVLASLELARRYGVRSILNPSPVDSAFAWAAHPIDVVVVNEHECGECFGHQPAELGAMSVAARSRLLDRFGVSNLVITQGRLATLHFSASETHEAPTYAVDPVDTVGAGDTFSGVLAAQLACGAPWATALCYANVAAALSTLALGAQTAMPTKSAVESAQARTRALPRPLSRSP
jgi:ribokinase